ncbi:hypothetical protein U2F10_08230 [Leptothoe sp. EHU-05/26/07-4]
MTKLLISRPSHFDDSIALKHRMPLWRATTLVTDAVLIMESFSNYTGY